MTTNQVTGGRVDGETTVLFVDDEPEILEMYELLCQAEYDVRTASTGAEALERLDGQVDIAFFDRRMPDRSGDDLIETVRAEGYETAVGVLSAVDPDPGAGIEVDIYLTKPVTREELFAAIDEHGQPLPA